MRSSPSPCRGLCCLCFALLGLAGGGAVLLLLELSLCGAWEGLERIPCFAETGLAARRFSAPATSKVRRVREGLDDSDAVQRARRPARAVPWQPHKNLGTSCPASVAAYRTRTGHPLETGETQWPDPTTRRHRCFAITSGPTWNTKTLDKPPISFSYLAISGLT